VRRLVTTAAVLALAWPTLSAAQLAASDTTRCINAINKGTRKVTLAASKEVAGCVAREAGELLGDLRHELGLTALVLFQAGNSRCELVIAG
jgi:hypothetical protein